MRACSDAHAEVQSLMAAVGACSIRFCKPLCD
jgi:hypothetical protein